MRLGFSLVSLLGTGCILITPLAVESSETTEAGMSCGLEGELCTEPPDTPSLSLDFRPIKQFDFRWGEVQDAAFYQLEESVSSGEPWRALGETQTRESLSWTMPLALRHSASYRLLACNQVGCTASSTVDVAGSLATSVGYVKASNSDPADRFGYSVALSADGRTLAVGARGEDSQARGIDGEQADNSAVFAGAVYIYVREGSDWRQDAYVKASNSDASDEFGFSVALSADGRTLAVGARGEDSDANGLNGDQADNSAEFAGAVYVYKRGPGDGWRQEAYVKASNSDAVDDFGFSVALSGDGRTLAVGAPDENSDADGVEGDQTDNSAEYAGAVYIYSQEGDGAWRQEAYVKASNSDAGDEFGFSVALSADGTVLAVGARGEGSQAGGPVGDPADNSAAFTGAAYVYVQEGASNWRQDVYIKASNGDAGDQFGYSLALSGDGRTLAVGAPYERSQADGIDGDQGDNSAESAGAVYVFARQDVRGWSQEAYVKASNSDGGDEFGFSVALSTDGGSLAIGGHGESGSADGIGGSQADNSAESAGAVWAYARDMSRSWTQKAYVKASNSGEFDQFGFSLALSGDGETLAVGAPDEQSDADGIDGDQTDNSIDRAGAVYLY